MRTLGFCHSHNSLCAIWYDVIVLLQHLWRRERSAILLFDNTDNLMRKLFLGLDLCLCVYWWVLLL